MTTVVELSKGRTREYRYVTLKLDTKTFIVSKLTGGFGIEEEKMMHHIHSSLATAKTTLDVLVDDAVRGGHSIVKDGRLCEYIGVVVDRNDWLGSYWRMVDFVDYANNKDDELIWARLRDRYTREEMIQFSKIHYEQIFHPLEEIVFEDPPPPHERYIDGSDDAHMDFTNFIISLGKDVYERALADPVSMIEAGRESRESFAMAFNPFEVDDPDDEEEKQAKHIGSTAFPRYTAKQIAKEMDKAFKFPIDIQNIIVKQYLTTRQTPYTGTK